MHPSTIIRAGLVYELQGEVETPNGPEGVYLYEGKDFSYIIRRMPSGRTLQRRPVTLDYRAGQVQAGYGPVSMGRVRRVARLTTRGMHDVVTP